MEHTIETVVHESETLRVRIVPDPEPYDTGDLFGLQGAPGADPEELADLEREFLRKLYDNGGPWAYIVERKCPTCGAWEHVDSCWGFDGEDHSFALESGVEAMNYEADARARGE